jgi:RES domain-containing protein
MHDHELKAILRALDAEAFIGELWRVTEAERDPTAGAVEAGRWERGIPAVYGALSPEGAVAEFRHACGGRAVQPVLHRLHVAARATLRLEYDLLQQLGVPRAEFAEIKRDRCQEIGTLAASLGFDSIVAPSARWNTQNLVLFLPNADDDTLRLIRSDALAANTLEVN